MLKIHLFFKRIFDIIFSFIGLVILTPFFVIIGAFILLDSKGPVIFRQLRLGLNGKPFLIFKFRSMVEKAEFTGTGLFNYEDDPRVTRVGKFLRNYSIDELPQIINILRGDMSFVGPRPPVTYELGKYEEFDARLKERFTVKPGITGMAQIAGRNELNWDEKIEYDLLYIARFRTWGLLFDIKILVITFFKVLRKEGSHELPENMEVDRTRMKH